MEKAWNEKKKHRRKQMEFHALSVEWTESRKIENNTKKKIEQ